MAKKVTEKSITPSDKTFGVILIAFGHASYFKQAYNLAYSIRHYNKTLPITIHVDSIDLFNTTISFEKQAVFSSIEVFDRSKFKDNADVKLHIDKFCTYDCSLYLDTDTVCLNDPEFLFEGLKSKDYVVHSNNAPMLWATDKAVSEHYGINEPLLSINSSVQYIEKGEMSTAIFEKARGLFSKPIPISHLKNSWGKTQPDELYLNIAISVLKTHSSFEVLPVCFIHAKSTVKPPYHKIKSEYAFISYFGPQGHTPYQYIESMDNDLASMHKAKNQVHTGQFKIGNLLKYKHANRSKPTR